MINFSKEQSEIFNELKKLSKRANQRIVRLERQFGKNSWGVKELERNLNTPKLQAWSIYGRSTAKKNMTISQMKAEINVLEKFLNKKSTSTISGIKKTIKTQKENLRKRLKKTKEEIEEEFTEKEVEEFYNFWEDDDFKGLVKYVDYSELETVINESMKEYTTLDDFSEQLKQVARATPDLEFQRYITRFYIKHIEKR